MKILLVLLALSSCSSRIEVITPSSNFILPEANGEFANTDLNINHSNGSVLAITVDETDSKVSTHSPHLFDFKIQVKGDPKIKAEKENISVAFNRTHTVTEMCVSVRYRFKSESLTYIHLEKISEQVNGQII